MGNKPKVTCAACGKVYKYKSAGLSSERCPGCAAPRVLAPAPTLAKRGKKMSAGARAFLAQLDAQTALVDAPGAALEEALAAICASPVLSLDSEGVRLSRTGQLTLLQVGTAERVFIFDILALGGEAAFSTAPPGGTSLRQVLQDAARTKLVWDVRRDADALCHQHAVTLAGVVDVQLAAVAVRRAAGATVATLPGLPECLSRWVDKATAQACAWLKQHVGGEHELSDDFWARRPLSAAGKRYAAADALLTRALHDALAPELARIGMLERVQLASDARLREFRDLPHGVPQERTAAHRLAPEL